MIISFFGHSDYSTDKKHIELLLSLLKKHLETNEIEFYLGGYGFFDSFSSSFCTYCKNLSYKVRKVFVTPYIGSYLDNRKEILVNYDEIIYPPLENVPKRFAITKRNEWIIERSDLIIFYVSRNYGGAYNALQYANRKNKPYINLFLK